jgi:hypothetical protein
MQNEVMKTEDLQRKSLYVNLNGSTRQMSNVNETKDKLYKKAVKLYERLINSELSVFSSKNTLIDLLPRNEAEFALIQNYRIQKYNEDLEQAKNLYRKIVKK